MVEIGRLDRTRTHYSKRNDVESYLSRTEREGKPLTLVYPLLKHEHYHWVMRCDDGHCLPTRIVADSLDIVAHCAALHDSAKATIDAAVQVQALVGCEMSVSIDCAHCQYKQRQSISPSYLRDQREQKD